MIQASAACWLVVGGTIALCGSARAAEPIVVTVGAASTTSDAPIYIADKKGYFSDEGLAVKVADFRSAADMVPPLGTGLSPVLQWIVVPAAAFAWARRRSAPA